MDTGICRHARVGVEHEALCFTYAPDGTILASGHQDGTVRLWDPAT